MQKEKSAHSNIVSFIELYRLAGVKWANFIAPVLLSFVIAACEGLSIGMLIPLLKGIFEKDFSFLKSVPVLKLIPQHYPQMFTGNQIIPVFLFFVAIIFAAIVLKNALQYLSSMIIQKEVVFGSDKLRQAVFSRYMDFGKLYFDRISQGYIQQLLLGFSAGIIYQMSQIVNFLSESFMFIVYLAIMFIISWKLTLAAIFIFPSIHFSSRWIIKRIEETSELSLPAHARLYEKVFNVFSCLPLVKLYTNEEGEKKEFSAVSNEVSRWQFSMDKKNYLVGPFQEVVMAVAILLLVTVMVFLVIKDPSSEVPLFLVFFYVLRKTASSFNFFGSFRATLAGFIGQRKELLKLFDDKDKFFVPSGNRKLESFEKNIQIKGLSYSYLEGLPVLRDVSFCVERQKSTAIVGPTGTGKTTLVNLILRFYDCPPGSIFVDDIDIREFDLKSLRRHMALVAQDSLLFNDTLKANITYGLNRVIAEDELIEVAKKARLFDFIASLPDGFNTLIGDRGVKLSGGEKQRVAIARALLKGSQILILDEATSSLDSITERLIQEAIDEALKGKTAIVIAHRLSTIKNVDKIIVIEDGRLAEEGSLNELLEKKGKFYKYWQEQKFD